MQDQAETLADFSGIIKNLQLSRATLEQIISANENTLGIIGNADIEAVNDEKSEIVA